MPSDLVPIVTVITGLVAFIVVARAFLLWRSIERLRADVRAGTIELEAGPERIRASVTAFRGKLDETSPVIERALWSLASFDQWSAEMEGAVRARRTGIEEIRERYLGGARRGMARVRRAVSVLKQLIDLRRILQG